MFPPHDNHQATIHIRTMSTRKNTHVRVASATRVCDASVEDAAGKAEEGFVLAGASPAGLGGLQAIAISLRNARRERSAKERTIIWSSLTVD